MPTETVTPPEPEADEGRQRTDPELLILGRILRLLNDVEEPGRTRIMAYLSSRFNGGKP
jgi:hypothetical protein